MTYKFKYKRWYWFTWRTKEVVGHALETNGVMKEPTGAMICYLPNGTIYRIPKWNECYLFLDTDWLLFQKKTMENESGQTIYTRF
jgi:hypothetical protein